MPDDSRASNITPPPAFGGADYDAIFAALAGSERGRWFLEEYGRRRRGADTDLVLAAIGRIEAAMQPREPASRTPLPDTVRRDLTGAAEALSRARQGIGYGGIATAGEAETGDAAGILRTLIDEIDWRLQSLTEALLPAEEPVHETRDLAAPPPATPPADFEEFTVAESEQPLPAQETTDPLADLTTSGFSEPAPDFADAAAATVADWAFPDRGPDQRTQAEAEQTQRPALDLDQPGAASDEVSEAVALREPASESSPQPEWMTPDWIPEAGQVDAGRVDALLTPPQADSAPGEQPFRGDLLQSMPEPLRIDDVVGRPERLDASPIRAAIEALIAAEPMPPTAPRYDASLWVPTTASEPPTDFLLTQAPSPQDEATNGAMFEAGLFDAEPTAAIDANHSEEAPPDLIESAGGTEQPPGSDDFWRDLANGNGGALASATQPEPPAAMPPPAQPASTAAEPTKEKADVLQRLEHVRKSIASLMDEIAVKTGRPIERPQR